MAKNESIPIKKIKGRWVNYIPEYFIMKKFYEA
jgi:hypothetical protein